MALVVVALEVATRFVIPLVNANTKTFAQEYRATRTLTRSGAGISVLLLGNSLTRTDVDMPLLKVSLGTGIKVQRWCVDDTRYLDWLFSLR